MAPPRPGTSAAAGASNPNVGAGSGEESAAGSPEEPHAIASIEAATRNMVATKARVRWVMSSPFKATFYVKYTVIWLKYTPLWRAHSLRKCHKIGARGPGEGLARPRS